MHDDCYRVGVAVVSIVALVDFVIIFVAIDILPAVGIAVYIIDLLVVTVTVVDFALASIFNFNEMLLQSLLMSLQMHL